MPSGNAAQQAQFLDEWVEEATREERGGDDDVEREDRRSKKLRLRKMDIGLT